MMRLGAPDDAQEELAVAAGFRVLESQLATVKWAQMIVRDNGIAFAALLRHADAYLTTAEIPKEAIGSAMTLAAA